MYQQAGVPPLGALAYKQLRLMLRNNQITPAEFEIYNQYVPLQETAYYNHYASVPIEKLKAYRNRCNNLQNLNKSQLIQCVLRKYPEFQNLLLRCRKGAAIMYSQDLPRGPLDFGVNWKLAFEFLFNFMPRGEIGPWSPSIYGPKPRTDVPGMVSRDYPWPNLRGRWRDSATEPPYDFPRFTIVQFEEFVKIFYPFYKILFPGNIHHPQDQPHGYPHYMYILNDITGLDGGPSPGIVMTLLQSMHNDLSRLEIPYSVWITLIAAGVNASFAERWINMWVRGKYINPYSGKQFHMQIPLPGPNALQDSKSLYSVFTYNQIMKALDVFTVEQLIYIINI